MKQQNGNDADVCFGTEARAFIEEKASVVHDRQWAAIQNTALSEKAVILRMMLMEKLWKEIYKDYFNFFTTFEWIIIAEIPLQNGYGKIMIKLSVILKKKFYERKRILWLVRKTAYFMGNKW